LQFASAHLWQFIFVYVYILKNFKSFVVCINLFYLFIFENSFEAINLFNIGCVLIFFHLFYTIHAFRQKVDGLKEPNPTSHIYNKDLFIHEIYKTIFSIKYANLIVFGELVSKMILSHFSTVVFFILDSHENELNVEYCSSIVHKYHCTRMMQKRGQWLTTIIVAVYLYTYHIKYVLVVHTL
jgi:hypothetical protein